MACDIDIVAHDTEMIFAGRTDIEGAVDLAMQVGPLSRAALPAATWIVVAR